MKLNKLKVETSLEITCIMYLYQMFIYKAIRGFFHRCYRTWENRMLFERNVWIVINGKKYETGENIFSQRTIPSRADIKLNHWENLHLSSGYSDVKRKYSRNGLQNQISLSSWADIWLYILKLAVLIAHQLFKKKIS